MDSAVAREARPPGDPLSVENRFTVYRMLWLQQAAF